MVWMNELLIAFIVLKRCADPWGKALLFEPCDAGDLRLKDFLGENVKLRAGRCPDKESITINLASQQLGVLLGYRSATFNAGVLQ